MLYHVYTLCKIRIQGLLALASPRRRLSRELPERLEPGRDPLRVALQEHQQRIEHLVDADRLVQQARQDLLRAAQDEIVTAVERFNRQGSIPQYTIAVGQQPGLLKRASTESLLDAARQDDLPSSPPTSLASGHAFLTLEDGETSCDEDCCPQRQGAA